MPPCRRASRPRWRGPPRTPKASLADYADAADTQASWERFVVVAHSSGGAVAMELLARHPGRVAGILGVAAVVPGPGKSFARTMPFPASLALGVVLRLAGTRPPAKAIRAGLAAGLPDAVEDRIVADFDPESVGLYCDPAQDRELPAARAYLRTTQDPELTAAVQQNAATTLQARWTEELATGHLPMLQDPGTVTRAIHRLHGEVR